MTAVAAATSADELLRRCLASYPGAYEDEDASEQDSIRRVAEHLNAADSEAAVCIICLELLKREDAVWSCRDGCCDTVHLACIQAWARQQIREAAVKADAQAVREDAAAWCCPKCRCEYPAAAVPNSYLCYCGKHVDPQPSLWLPAHSCGDTCGRQLPCGQSHGCMLLCHPGPCPACPRMVSLTCHCGKVETQRRCHQSTFSCGKLCGRQLGCGHRCPRRCHGGQCPPCGLSKERTCACGLTTAVAPCSVGDYHCGPCAQMHDCGQHNCTRDCHAGSCGACPMSGPRTCGCGKTAVAGLSCQEPTPTCGATCDRVLPCGLHRCIERCHTGMCPDICRTMTEKSCACGSLRKDVPCCESLRCQRKCAELRNCGRHACRRRCCDGDHPTCQEECGRLLKCGNHRCKAPCHAGKCLPCTRELHVACACGTTSYRLPCGWEARAKPPVCAQHCRVPRVCRHAKMLPPHRCHFGPCPPCAEPCGSVLQPCGHRCAVAQCHDMRPPDIPEFQQPPPPQQPALAFALDVARPPAASAQAAEVAAKLQAGTLATCPPCNFLVKRWCQGAHKLIQQPCSDASLKSCGQPCGRRLPCGSHFASGIHLCTLPCHPLSTENGPKAMPAGTTAEPGCETCTLPCGRQRSGCPHPCQEHCHAGDCSPCNVDVTQACHCGRTNLPHQCHELAEGDAAIPLGCGKQCLRPLPACPHLCMAQCHASPCPGVECCKEEVAVRCGCRRLKERWQCHRVQAELRGRGLSQNGSYEGAAALRLLPCTAQCKSAKAAATVAPQQRQPVSPQTVVEPGPEQQQQQISRRQRAKDRGSAGVEDVGPTVADVVSNKLRRLQRRSRKHAVPIVILFLGVVCAYLVYISL